MSVDIGYIKYTNKLTQVPLVITGEVSGLASYIQRFITLLCSEKDNTREFGGGLLSLMRGANISETYVKEYINTAALSTANYLLENGVPIGSTRITDVVIQGDSAVIKLNVFIMGYQSAVEFSVALDGE